MNPRIAIQAILAVHEAYLITWISYNLTTR
jgi:hypothetical protein